MKINRKILVCCSVGIEWKTSHINLEDSEIVVAQKLTESTEYIFICYYQSYFFKFDIINYKIYLTDIAKICNYVN